MARNIKRWNPDREITRQEKFLLKRGRRVKKLFGFLRTNRHELFDDEFQAELETVYRAGGKPPVPPAMMAMAPARGGSRNYLGAGVPLDEPG